MSKQRKPTATSRGVLAVTLLAIVYGMTAVTARYLGNGLHLYEQWYLRYGLAFVFSLVAFYSRVDLTKFRRLPARDWWVLWFRVVTGSVLAIALYTMAAQQAKIGPVALMQIMPTTALFGVILFHEKLSKARASLLVLSLIGAAIVVVSSIHDLAQFNLGELWSLISGALFGLALVTRRWHSEALNNYEITIAITGMAAVANYVISLCLYHRAFIPTAHFTPGFSVVLIFAGSLSVIINFLSNYGFEHVSAVLAGTILNLEVVVGGITGYLFYNETLSVREIAGGVVILLSVVLMNEVSKREELAATSVKPAAQQ